MSADKFDMLFIFMFTVAGIFQLIIVRWDVFLLPTHCFLSCNVYKWWFYNQLVFILPGLQGESRWVQHRGGTPLPTNRNQITLINISLWPRNHYKWQWWIAPRSCITQPLLYLNKKKIHTSSCFKNVLSCIYNILHISPQALMLHTELAKQIRFL